MESEKNLPILFVYDDKIPVKKYLDIVQGMLDKKPKMIKVVTIFSCIEITQRLLTALGNLGFFCEQPYKEEFKSIINKKNKNKKIKVKITYIEPGHYYEKEDSFDSVDKLLEKK